MALGFLGLFPVHRAAQRTGHEEIGYERILLHNVHEALERGVIEGPFAPLSRCMTPRRKHELAGDATSRLESIALTNEDLANKEEVNREMITGWSDLNADALIG